MRRKWLAIGLSFIILLLLFPNQSLKSMMRPISVEELTEKSELIIMGKVEKVKGYKEKGDKGMIYSVATINVDEVIKGEISGKKILVEYLGGSVEGEKIALGVSVVDPLREGEKVLLFLFKRKSMVLDTDVYLINYVTSGTFKIDKNGETKKGGFVLEHGKRKPFQRMHVQELIKIIRKAK